MSKAEIIKLVIEFVFYGAIIITSLAAPPLIWSNDDVYSDNLFGLVCIYGFMLFFGAIVASLVWLVFNVN